MKRFIYIISFFFLSFFACPHAIYASSANDHIERGNKHLINDRAFAAVEEFRQAIEKGADDPILFRNLSIILYDLGFLDEAITYMKKALSISPYANSFQMELGIIYLAQDRNEKAREQFMTVLGRNPGFSSAYYYIGETFFRTKEYSMAWIFAETAKKLSHKGSSLITKLEKVSTPTDIKPWNMSGDQLLIRQILVDTRPRADEIIKRISEGELFEDVATEIDKTLNSVGGFLGYFKKSELHSKISKALSKRKAFSDPVIVETELGFHIVQRIVPFDFNKWDQMLADYERAKEHEISIAATPKQKKAEERSDTFSESIISRDTTILINESAPPIELSNTARTASDREKTNRKPYLVFSGAFSKEKNANERVQKLQSLGYPSYIHIRQTEKGPVHMVVAGKFDGFQKAQEAGHSIATHGLDYFISR
jgi:tetratricopeptide (TPR) repeat protein